MTARGCPVRPGVGLLVAGLALCWGSGCASTTDAKLNRTFYDWSLGDGSQAFEHPFPELDWPDHSTNSRFIGVSVLEGVVRFSRPRNWRMRQASNRPDEPYVHYVSPSAYAFAIYQRRDPPTDTWEEILGRFEADVEATGGTIVGGAVPFAVARGQGWGYSIERQVEATRHPLVARSREYVLRDDNVVVLVQIVHQEKDLSDVDDELLRAVGTLHLR